MIATVFDTETTGLIDNHTLRLDHQPEVVEFAAISVDWGELAKVYSTWEFLIRPQGKWHDEKKRPPISDEELAAAEPFVHHAHTIMKIFESSDVVVGQNLSFDMEMIDLEMDRVGFRIGWPRRRVCTVEQSSFFVGRRLNLSELHRRLLGREHQGAHRAMNDVIATLNCLREMRRLAWL